MTCPTTWADFRDAATFTCTLPHAEGCICPSGSEPKTDLSRPCPCNLGLVAVECECGGWLVTPDGVDADCEFCETKQVAV